MRPYSRKALRLFSASLVALLVLAGTPAHAEDRDAPVVQVGTYDYLIQPDFTGLAAVGDIARGQTLGIGTFADLDGELVMVGGSVYQIRPDGVPRAADLATRTPFMQAIRFRPRVNVAIPPGTPCAAMTALIMNAAEKSNGIVAVRLRGTFAQLSTRSINADPPPFQPLAQTVAEQTVFNLDGRRAVLVGFWQGRDALGVGQDGLHLHGLTADRRAGGHVLSCVAGSDVQLSVQPVSRIELLTP
jgi:acetolactate decarboxylase